MKQLKEMIGDMRCSLTVAGLCVILFRKLRVTHALLFGVIVLSVNAMMVFAVPPEGLIVNDPPAFGGILVRWEAVDEAARYVVRRAESDSFQSSAIIATNVETTSFFDGGSSEETDYFYWVSRGSIADESEFAGPVSGRHATTAVTYDMGVPIALPPALAKDGTLYLTIFDESEWKGSLMSVARDGSVNWEYDPGVSSGFGRLAVGSDGTVIAPILNSLHAVGSDGFLKWKHDAESGFTGYPAIASNGTIFAMTDDGFLQSIDKRGKLLWRIGLNGHSRSAPILGPDGSIYVVGGADRRLYAVSDSGNIEWRAGGTPDRITSSPAIADDGTIIAARGLLGVIAFNPDGSLKWKTNLGREILFTPLIASDGTIICINSQTIFRLSPDGEEVGRVEWDSISWVFGGPMLLGGDELFYGSVDESWELLDSELRFSGRIGFDIANALNPVVGSDGTIVIVSRDGSVTKIGGRSAPTVSPWPSERRDARLSGAVPRIFLFGPEITREGRFAFEYDPETTKAPVYQFSTDLREWTDLEIPADAVETGDFMNKVNAPVEQEKATGFFRIRSE